jgi:DNA topoisomerase-1
VSSKERKRRPSPPFITSTLQQEAARKLGFTTSRTMRVAQKLYEGFALGDEGTVGLISYMRTDSTHLSDEALSELRDVIARDFGTGAVPDKPNVYKTKSKNAQEAHEAIRPTSALRTPASVAKFLGDDERRLYELIWKRTVASQMVPATLNTVSVELAAGSQHAFRASGTTVVDPGFLAVYEEGKDTRTSDDEDEGRKLPAMKLGQNVPLASIHTDQHFTEPPPRFSEASLVKALEEFGIGRPSTYASIIQVLQFRQYVLLENRRFKPTDVGRAVSKFLSGRFTAVRGLRLHRQARGRAGRGLAWRGGMDAAARALLEGLQEDGRRGTRRAARRRRHRARARPGPQVRQAGHRAHRPLRPDGADRHGRGRGESRPSPRCARARASSPSPWTRR